MSQVTKAVGFHVTKTPVEGGFEYKILALGFSSYPRDGRSLGLSAGPVVVTVNGITSSEMSFVSDLPHITFDPRYRECWITGSDTDRVYLDWSKIVYSVHTSGFPKESSLFTKSGPLLLNYLIGNCPDYRVRLKVITFNNDDYTLDVYNLSPGAIEELPGGTITVVDKAQLTDDEERVLQELLNPAKTVNRISDQLIINTVRVGRHRKPSFELTSHINKDVIHLDPDLEIVVISMIFDNLESVDKWVRKYRPDLSDRIELFGTFEIGSAWLYETKGVSERPLGGSNLRPNNLTKY